MIPASSPGETSSSSTAKPRFSAQRISIRSTISAQSWASVPPGAGVDGHERVAGVVGAGEQPLLLERVEPRLNRLNLLLELGGDLRILLGQLGQRLEILDVVLEIAEDREPASRASMLGADPRRVLLVVPEPGRPHLVFERPQALRQRSGVKDSPRAA